jgi:hypothetical protein
MVARPVIAVVAAILMIVPVQVTERAVIGAMLGTALKPFLVRPFMSFSELVMKCAVPVVPLVMGERRECRQCRKGKRSGQKCTLQLHDMSPNPKRLTLRYVEPVPGKIGTFA